MDRVFYTNACSGKNLFYLKLAMANVSARRAGTTAALDQLNKYFTISQMPIISSNYWNMIHGAKPEDVAQDLRLANYAYPSKKYGLVFKMQRSWRESRCCCANY